MEFRCPSCKEITENEFINRIYNEMKYQCLGCRKEWKIIFVENKSISNIQPENLHSFPNEMINGNINIKGFHLPFHEIYGDSKKIFCRHCELTRLNSDRFKKEFLKVVLVFGPMITIKLNKRVFSNSLTIQGICFILIEIQN